MTEYHFTRTESGTAQILNGKTALKEINAAMMEPVKQGVDTMSSVRDGGYHIEYRGGRVVDFTRHEGPMPTPEPTVLTAEKQKPVVEVTATEADGPARPYSNGPTRTVTVKGKTYIVGQVVSARPKTADATYWIPVAYVNYWSARGGKAFGPTQGARADAKPGTVGRAIWDAIQP